MAALARSEANPKARMNVLRDMILFVEVGRRENFTNAAKSLGMPLSTLARRIASLEEDLGMLLVERTTRQQRLTVDGLRYFERCQHVVDDALAAYDDVHAQSHGLGGSIRLAVPLEILNGFMVDAIAAFLQQHESISVLVDVASGATLPGTDCDLLVRVGKPEEQWLVTSKTGAVPLALYAAPAYLGRNAPVESRKQLKQHNLLFSSDCAHHCAPLLRDMAPANLNMNGRLSCDTFQPVASFAALGYGIAILPVDIAAPHVMAGSLAPVLPGWSPAALPIFLVTTSKLLPARLRTLVSFLSKRFWTEFNPRQGAVELVD